MDLSQNLTQKTGTLNVKGPKGDDTGITIELYGADTDVYSQATADLLSARAKMPDDSGQKTQQARKAIAEMYATCTAGWEGLDWKGEELLFSHENALMLYSQEGIKWLLDQIRKFINDRQNFLPDGSES